jgi:3-oxoacyl-[acyl-carrier protein] reductase
MASGSSPFRRAASRVDAGELGVRETLGREIEGRTTLRRAATLEDVGNVAVFAASDPGPAMTATCLNVTCGSTVD